PPPAAPAARVSANPCEPYRPWVDPWLDAKLALRSAEAAVERLEASPILGSRTGCSDSAIAAGRCSETWYSRDEALDRANEKRTLAEERLARAEESSRVAGVPMACLIDPAE
ncbi:MAG: hypothetical protein ACHQ6T_14145, partial [Myxococcota bacterium]